MADDSSSDSFSSDSDDEFLVGDGKGVDREALVRKKLLESFYGKTSQGDDIDSIDDSDSSSDESTSDDDSLANMTDDEDGLFKKAHRRRKRSNRVMPVSGGNGDEDDLDSVHFDAPKHTERFVLKSSVHPLLETEESLACQVRTLDSSMQTLVYENYSRFIEATDAVRNIGVNVQCNAGNLKNLSASVVEAGETARVVETSCGKLRDQVVEKLRTKRLLQRLETLLKLPSTLRDSIASGRYRWATKSYLKAYAILNKQSDGFESLQRIEQECHKIMEVLLDDSRTKLLHWSGNLALLNEESERDFSEDESKTNEALLTKSSEDPPDPPENVAGIFECAGTPVLILNHRATTTQVGLQAGLTEGDCQEMSLDACLRLIERFLDTHSIELQEAMLEDTLDHPASLGDAPNDSNNEKNNNGSKLVPTNVLDSILEAAALYSVTFPSGQSSERLSQFVSTAFNAFLQHVRRALLDQSAQTAYPKDLQRSISSSDVREETERGDAADDDDDEGQDDSEDQAYEHIANATALLLESVQQFSSGLALPEVAIDQVLASSLVEQTRQISEAMVRRRVDQKFYILRFRVLQNCLAPFCRQALKVESETTKERIDRLVQMASVALSDSSQLVDDTVRSILSSDTTSNNAILKAAVEQSTARFAGWLAGAMEVLAGCESSDPNHVLDVLPETPEDGENETGSSNIIHPSLFRHFADTGDNDLAELVENCMSDLLEELEELGVTSEASVKSCLTLVIAEMCQLAERTVVDDINQSISTHTGGFHKHRNVDGLFASTERGGITNRASKKDPTSMRFRLAASRVLSLYAMNRGDEAVQSLCSNMLEFSKEGEEESSGPRVGTWSVLSLVKAAAFDCAALFGGPKRAGPVPEVLEDEFASLTATRQKQAFRSALAFDVERMFAEKVVAYPHPFENVSFDRNFVVVQVLKVALKALREDVRLVRFSNHGYRQLLVDVEFLKFMMPHYVKDEALSDHSTTNPLSGLESLLAETINNAKERCDASAMLQDDTVEINQARAVVRDFMASNSGEDGLLQRFTIPEEEDEETSNIA